MDVIGLFMTRDVFAVLTPEATESHFCRRKKVLNGKS